MGRAARKAPFPIFAIRPTRLSWQEHENVLEHSGLLILLKQDMNAVCGPQNQGMMAGAAAWRSPSRMLTRMDTWRERRTMTERISIRVLDRRELLLGARAAAAVATFLAFTNMAQAESRPAEASWEEAVRKVIGDAKPIEGKLLLDLPEIAENGNTVPFSLSVESPMTEHDYVKAVHVFSTSNPQPTVATFYFTPASGKASVVSRMRLAKTQDVVGVAEASDGKFMIATRTVKVTIGGCGG
jgi:sulfur-oxidizing protein SoxY